MSDEKTDNQPTISAHEAAPLTVYFDSALCTQAGECVRGLPAVFDHAQSPWIQPQNAAAEQVAEVIRRCPSGALQYDIAGGEAEQPELPTRIDPQVDGALLVRGDLRIALKEGVMTATRAALCRCGRSGNKPFCDKTCEASGWRSEWHPPAE
jgi:uncharacterized Fe-S cluster protein YjdI/CDGSH-type Zn-finger protein